MTKRKDLISDIREALDELEEKVETTKPQNIPHELKSNTPLCRVEVAPDDKIGDYFIIPDDSSVKSRNAQWLDRSDRFTINYWSWKDEENYANPVLLVGDTEQ